MRVIDRSQFLDGAQSYGAENPGCLVVAGATTETEEAFLAALHRIAGVGEGIATRMGYKSFIVVTSLSQEDAIVQLKASCEGTWCHYLASVSKARSLDAAIHETEWRSMKGVSHASSCEVEVLP